MAFEFGDEVLVRGSHAGKVLGVGDQLMLVGHTVGESYTETAFSVDSEGVRPMPPKKGKAR